VQIAGVQLQPARSSGPVALTAQQCLTDQLALIIIDSHLERQPASRLKGTGRHQRLLALATLQIQVQMLGIQRHVAADG
jgi:hypothetical protein